MALVKAKVDLDHLFVDQLANWIQEEIYANVTMLGKFSPLTISAAAPYLTGRLLKRWSMNQQGVTLSAALPHATGMGDSIAIRKHLLGLGADYLRDDWSKYVGEGQLLALKKQIASHTYGSYPNLAAMEQKFDDEWPKLLLILEQIETRLEAEIPKDTIVVLRSMRWWDDTEHLKSVFEGMAKRETKTGINSRTHNAKT